MQEALIQYGSDGEGPGPEHTFAWSYVNGPSSDPEERTVDQVINGVTKNESPRERPKTLPEKNGPENGAFTVAPAPTVRGTLIVIVVSSRPSGAPGVSPGASDWIRTEAAFPCSRPDRGVPMI